MAKFYSDEEYSKIKKPALFISDEEYSKIKNPNKKVNKATTTGGDSLGEEAKIIGAEIASSIASQAVGAATLNPLTYLAITVGGGFSGSVAAQKNFGDGEVNYGRAVFNGFLTAIPFAPAIKNLTKFSTITKSMIKDAAVVEGKRGVGKVLAMKFLRHRKMTVKLLYRVLVKGL